MSAPEETARLRRFIELSGEKLQELNARCHWSKYEDTTAARAANRLAIILSDARGCLGNITARETVKNFRKLRHE